MISKTKHAFGSMYQVRDLAEFGIEPYPVSKVFVRVCVPAVSNDPEYGAGPSGIL